MNDGAKEPRVNCCLLFNKILTSVSVLHKNGIAHNDIKWSNILLENELEWPPKNGFNIVLADFGISCSKGTQYVTELPSSIPKPKAPSIPKTKAQVFSSRAATVLRKSLEQPIVLSSSTKQGFGNAATPPLS